MRDLTVRIGLSGALIDVHIGVTGAKRKLFQRSGRPVPPPVMATLLVDTGASSTLLDDQIIRALGLQPIDSVRFHSASTKGVPARCDVVDVCLILGGISTAATWRADPLKVLSSAMLNSSHQGLLGRDVLDRLLLAWNGPAQSLVMSYP